MLDAQKTLLDALGCLLLARPVICGVPRRLSKQMRWKYRLALARSPVPASHGARGCGPSTWWGPRSRCCHRRPSSRCSRPPSRRARELAEHLLELSMKSEAKSYASKLAQDAVEAKILDFNNCNLSPSAALRARSHAQRTVLDRVERHRAVLLAVAPDLVVRGLDVRAVRGPPVAQGSSGAAPGALPHHLRSSTLVASEDAPAHEKRTTELTSGKCFALGGNRWNRD